MSSAERAQRAAARFSARAEPAPPPPAVRTRRVRRTVDLPPATHHALTRWCAESAVEIGAARVSGQDVMVGLVELLLAEPDLSASVRTWLRAHGGQ